MSRPRKEADFHTRKSEERPPPPMLGSVRRDQVPQMFQDLEGRNGGRNLNLDAEEEENSRHVLVFLRDGFSSLHCWAEETQQTVQWKRETVVPAGHLDLTLSQEAVMEVLRLCAGQDDDPKIKIVER